MTTVDKQYAQFELNPGEYGTRKAPVRQVVWVEDPETVDIPRGEHCAGVDTETEPIVKGQPVDRVLTQVDYPGHCVTHLIPWPGDDRYIQRLLTERPDTQMAFLNIGFDFRVLGGRKNELLVQALSDGRLWDVGQRFCLIRLERGEFLGKWKLDYLAKRVLGWDLPKDDDVRMGYRRNMRMEERFVKYAAMDAVTTAELAATMPRSMPSEHIQNLGAVMLDQMGYNGFPVDRAYFHVLRGKLTRKRDKYLQLLDLFGYRPGEQGNTSVVQNQLADIEKYTGIQLPRTSTGLISASEESIADLGYTIDHPFIEALNRYSHYNKMLSNYLHEEFIGTDGKVHPFFNPMVSTGRTSASGPNVQNPSKKDGIRQIYVPEPLPVPEEPVDEETGTYNPGAIQVPRKDYLLLAVDIKQAELCTLAEECYLKYGFSRMMEHINAGRDLHQITASQYYNEPLENIGKGRKRDFGKVPNFGGPGLLGPKALVPYARQYGIDDLTVEQASVLLDAWKTGYPEMEHHLDPEPDDEFTTIEVEKYCRKHDYPKTGSFDKLREMVEDRIKAQRNAQEQGEKERPEEDLEDTDSSVRYLAFMRIKDCQRYQARLFTGRVYRNLTGPQACNRVFQGPNADACKVAGFHLYCGGYHEFLLNFIHDEFILKVKNDSSLQKNIRRINELMSNGLKQVVKNTTMSLENQLMDRWWKEAEDIYDGHGNLMLYTPDKVTNDIAFRYPDAEIIADPDDDETDVAADNVSELMEFIS